MWHIMKFLLSVRFALFKGCSKSSRSRAAEKRGKKVDKKADGYNPQHVRPKSEESILQIKTSKT